MPVPVYEVVDHGQMVTDVAVVSVLQVKEEEVSVVSLVELEVLFYNGTK